MSSIEQFSIGESFDYAALLQEAIETIRSANVELGLETRQTDEAIEAMLDPLQQLLEAKALFADVLTVQPLRKSDLEASGLELSPEVRQAMRAQNFYRVQIPVTLMPASGWAFTRLKCAVNFEVTGAETPPQIHDIYPEDVWTEILSLQTRFDLNLEEGLRIDLDQDLKFQASLDWSVALGQPAQQTEALANPVESLTRVAVTDSMSAEARARVGADVNGGMQLAVGPFSYGLRRAQILGRGRENSRVFWQLDGNTYVQKEEPYLAVVLRVPKGDGVVVNACGKLIAYHQFDLLAADIRKDFFGNFREKVKSFFSAGLPLEKVACWQNITTE